MCVCENGVRNTHELNFLQFFLNFGRKLPKKSKIGCFHVVFTTKHLQ